MKSEKIANAIRNIDDDIVNEASSYTANNATKKSSPGRRNSGSIFRAAAAVFGVVVLIAGGIVAGIVLGSRGRNTDPQSEASPYKKELFMINVIDEKLSFEVVSTFPAVEISCGGAFYAFTGLSPDAPVTSTTLVDILNQKNVIKAVNPSELSFSIRFSKSITDQGDDFCYDFNIYEGQNIVAVIDRLNGIQVGSVTVSDSELEALIDAYSPTLGSILKADISDPAYLFYRDKNDYSASAESLEQYGIKIVQSGVLDISSRGGSIGNAISSMHVFETDCDPSAVSDNWLTTFQFVAPSEEFVAVIFSSGPYLTVIEGEDQNNARIRIFRISRRTMSAFEGSFSIV